MRIWHLVAAVTDDPTERGQLQVGKIEVSGAIMRMTTINRIGGIKDHYLHEYAPLWGWDGRWMTLAEAEKKAAR